MKLFSVAAIVIIITMTALQPVDAGQYIEYKQFSLDKVSCDVATAYTGAEGSLELKVSAIAYGKGAEFRKWKVTSIRLTKGSKRIDPDKCSLFFVRKESIFRYPAAVVFAAIGSQASAAGSDLSKGITKIGSAIGLGLLVTQASGDIAGQLCGFSLSWDTVDKIDKDKDVIEIIVENTGLHLKETLKVGLHEPPAGEARFDYSGMKQDELVKMIEALDGQVSTLRKNQASYKSGTDPEYDEIQKKIDGLEVERALAHMACQGKREGAE